MIAPLLAFALAFAACSTAEPSASADVPGLPRAEGAAVDAELAEFNPIEVDAAIVDTVVMIGDSITVASTPALQAAFEDLGFDDIVIVAQQGKRTAVSFGDNPSGAEVARSLLDADEAVISLGESAISLGEDHRDELWVIALGTNDIGQYSDPAERVGAVNELLSEVPPDVPLIWVDTYFRDRPEDAEAVNAMIASRLRQRGNATIAAWSGVAGDDGNLRDDGVHPRDVGTLAFATLVRDTIEDIGIG